MYNEHVFLSTLEIRKQEDKVMMIRGCLDPLSPMTKV
jgi:hypothetical protein